MFLLKYLEVKEDEKEVLNIDFLGDREVDERPIFSTLILGENGTGKSFLLKTIVDIFIYISKAQIYKRKIIKFLVYCFDRPAFRDPISQEGRMEDFDKAIEDTIIALNTGILRTRDGSILRKSEGKSSVNNDEWREKLNVIGDMLSALRRRLKIAKAAGAYSTYGEGEVMYCFSDRQLGEWFDSTREEIVKILSSICEDMGMPGLCFLRNKYRW